MKEQNKLRLKEKGWTEEDIKKAESILEKQEEYDKHFSKIVFWSALIVTIFGNLIVSLVLIPFLIVLYDWVLYTVIILLAGTIGFLYRLLIMDIGHLDKKNHFFASILIPIIAIANMVGMVLISNKFITDLKLQNTQHNPWIAAVVFAIAMILPYLFGQMRLLLKEKKAKVLHLNS
ncbi:hypothetical protein COY27_03160 [Candidatus Woesearchaeota archaeon CG_4_10_14_0_2_um_filter_33_13]|nr:MAG: hypothetical protein COY27_03160 [Candidatus Woesearchaeota archaeon CG_4_10_14_0_2_um_filter_33_13]